MYSNLLRFFYVCSFTILFQTAAYAKPVLNEEKIKEGIISIQYKEKTEKKIKLIIEKDKQSITHDIKKTEGFEDFALTFGNGKYKISLYKNIRDNQYEPVMEKMIILSLKDPNSVFLKSTQQIHFTETDEAILYIKEHTKGLSEEKEKIKSIHQYIINHIAYDREKAKIVEKGYLPNIDDTFATQKGICQDYSVLFAAMARSLGIKTKLVKGYASYAPTTYHAWNEVLLEGEWITIDTTYDTNLYKNGRTIELGKNRQNYQVVNEY